MRVRQWLGLRKALVDRVDVLGKPVGDDGDVGDDDDDDDDVVGVRQW